MDYELKAAPGFLTLSAKGIEDRKRQCFEEIQKVLDKYGCTLSASVVVDVRE